MRARLMGLTVTIVGLALVGSVAARGAEPALARAGAASPVLAEKRQAVQGVSADAMAVLAAMQRDPTLGKQLAANPEGGEALLRTRGATRAEHIMVTAERKIGTPEPIITITIKIDHVTIVIQI